MKRARACAAGQNVDLIPDMPCELLLMTWAGFGWLGLTYQLLAYIIAFTKCCKCAWVALLAFALAAVMPGEELEALTSDEQGF
jgi:hypothetical protein